jgi:TetR/AcrR family transcriptional repressor of nem operon
MYPRTRRPASSAGRPRDRRKPPVCIKITDLLVEVDVWTAFAQHFMNLRNGDAATDRTLLLTAILADAINLGSFRGGPPKGVAMPGSLVPQRSREGSTLPEASDMVTNCPLCFVPGVPMKAVQQSRALATRDKILGAAANLFALRGFHNTKLDDVRREAGVTTGAFFHHFQSKDDLGFAVLNRHMQNRRQQLDRIESELPPGEDAGPLARVFRRLDATAEMLRRRSAQGGCIIGNLSIELSDTHEEFRVQLARCFDEMAQEFLPHLKKAVKECGGKQSPRELTRYIVTVIEGAIMQSRTHRDSKLVAHQLTALKEHLRTALKA